MFAKLTAVGGPGRRTIRRGAGIIAIVCEERPERDVLYAQLELSGFSKRVLTATRLNASSLNSAKNLGLVICVAKPDGTLPSGLPLALSKYDARACLLIGAKRTPSLKVRTASLPGAPPVETLLAAIHMLLDTRSRATERVPHTKVGRADAQILYKDLFDRLGDAIMLIDPVTHRIVDVNRAAERLYSYTRATLRGMSLLALIPRDQHASVMTNTRKILSAAGGVYVRDRTHIKKNGASIRVSITGALVPYGNARVIQDIVRDDTKILQHEDAIKRELTERKAAEKKLRVLKQEIERRVVERTAQLTLSEQKYRDMIEGSIQGIYVHRDFKLLQANPALAAMLGYDDVAELFALEDFATIIASEEGQRLRGYQRRRDLGKPVLSTYETNFLRKDGSTIACLLLVRTVSWDGFPAIQTTMIDISERARAESALKTSAALQANLLARLVSTQEEERARIARELHDGFGQTLTAISLNLTTLAGKAASTHEIEALQDSIMLVRNAIAEVRTLSGDLRPRMLDELGLIPTLRWYIQREAERAGVDITLEAAHIDLTMEPALSTVLFRIAQEAITNALKHAGARHIRVRIRKENAKLNMSISDDGNDMDITAVRAMALRGKSNGLLGMEERARLTGGTLKVESTLGSGTNVAFTTERPSL